MSQSIQFSINRISAPRIGFAEFAALTQRLGVHAIEIRNDLAGVEMVDGTPGMDSSMRLPIGANMRSMIVFNCSLEINFLVVSSILPLRSI